MILDLLLHILHDRTCLHCGSLSATRSLLCTPCFKILENSWKEELFISTYQFANVLSLLDWQPDQSDLASALIENLKGAKQKNAWKFYAEIFVRERLQFAVPVKNIRIVVPPAASKNRKHAEFWGEALANELSISWISPFENSSKTEQKRANKKIRLRRKLTLREEFSKLSKGSSRTLWIFADDIYTTGATARAAYEALGRPPHFEVWTLAQRGVSLRSVQDSAITGQ